MIAEQTTVCTFRELMSLPDREIRLTIRMEISAQESADVSTTLLFEPYLPERWQDMLHRHLYNGVHDGLAGSAAPIPQGGIAVEISGLNIHPHLESNSPKKDALWLGDVIQALTAEMVTTMLTGMCRPPQSRCDDFSSGETR